MRNYERVIKILDLCEEIVTSNEFKEAVLDILSDVKESIVECIGDAKDWVIEAVNERNDD